jgi:cyclic dehypoxanthinyl futalosine synthase
MSAQSEIDWYRNAPLLELGAAADAVRKRLHPEGIVSYIVDRNINYTNVCVADCGFCAFYRRPTKGGR